MKKWLFLLSLFLASVPLSLGQSSTGVLSAQASSCGPPYTNNTTACIFFQVPPSVNTVGASLQGTFSGTFQFEGTVDGTTWGSVQAFPMAGGSSVTSATSANQWQITPGGNVWIRIRCSTYSSGSATATLNPSNAVTANSSSSGGAVSSVFTRTGAVTATSGDYTCSLVTGCPTFLANAQTATYQVLAADFAVCKTIPVASGTFTITLVASGTQPASGQCINVVNYGSGVVTIARSGQNINGAASNLTLNAGSASQPTSTNITSDGTNYVATLDQGTLGTVTSVFTRSGAVVAASGDYTLDLINALAASKTIANGNNTWTVNSTQTTDSQDAVTFGETSAATGGTVTVGLANQSELHASTASGSTATPLEVDQGGVTGTVAFPAAQIETTWNNAGLTGMGFLMNVTDTLSNAASILAQFNVGGVFKWKMDKTGLETLAGGLNIPAGAVGAATLTFAGDAAGVGIYRAGAAIYGITNASNEFLRFSSSGVKGNSGIIYGMTASATSSTGSYDTCMARSAAGVMNINSDAACSNEAGLIRAGNPCRITADISISVSGTAVTVCQWSLPAVAKAWAWQCGFGWVISAGTTPTLSIGVNASQTPTGTTNGFGNILTTNADAGIDGSGAISASGATNLVTTGALTTAATIFQANSFGTVLASATAGTFTITMTGTGTSVAGLIKAGTTCTLN